MAKRENVFDLATFNFSKHYLLLHNKLKKLLKDFTIEDYIYFKDATGQNNCENCHFQMDEPFTHRQAKNKIFKLFVNEPNYLIESELKANKNLNVPGKGIRNYRFDIFVVDIKKFLKFQTVMADHNFNNTKLDIEKLKELEQGMLFVVELDGGGHSEKKDYVRDRFFFSTYNIVTVRFKVHQLVPMEETKKMQRLKIKYGIYKDLAFQPEYAYVTSEQIVEKARNLYEMKYFHL